MGHLAGSFTCRSSHAFHPISSLGVCASSSALWTSNRRHIINAGAMTSANWPSIFRNVAGRDSWQGSTLCIPAAQSKSSRARSSGAAGSGERVDWQGSFRYRFRGTRAEFLFSCYRTCASKTHSLQLHLVMGPVTHPPTDRTHRLRTSSVQFETTPHTHTARNITCTPAPGAPPQKQQLFAAPHHERHRPSIRWNLGS